MKKILGGEGGEWGVTTYEILSSTMIGRRKIFFMENGLQRLEKRNICGRQVMEISIIYRCLLGII